MMFRSRCSKFSKLDDAKKNTLLLVYKEELKKKKKNQVQSLLFTENKSDRRYKYSLTISSAIVNLIF